MSGGQCYGCGVRFGMFKSEKGCKNCGFAFCSKCLTKTIEVPKLNNTKHHVCKKCFEILTGKLQPKENPAKYSPPEALKKRVAALHEKEKNPENVARRAGKVNLTQNAKYIGLSKADREIAERLDKLKEKQTPETKVSDKDISNRLAKLKGVDPSTVQPSQKQVFYQPPDTRSDQKKVEDLLDEIYDEVEIDSHFPDPATDVQSRLDKLKNRTHPKTSEQDVTNNLNNESSARAKIFDKKINNTDANDNGDVSMEEMTRLIEEASKELEVDAYRALEGLKKDKEIMERLNELKKKKSKEGSGHEASSGTSHEDKMNIVEDDSDSENEEEAIKKLVKQYVEESMIDNSSDENNSFTTSSKPGISHKGKVDDVPSDYDDSDELPYCCLCNEDAIIRCLDCDMDLYCTKCLRASHDEIDIKDHRTKKYTPPKGYRDDL